MLVVLDTNILVSALWSKDGNPQKLLDLVVARQIIPCHDARIMAEYREVLARPQFRFSSEEISAVLESIERNGHSMVSVPIDIPFIDDADRKFYETAKFCCAVLITGNLKHFPAEPGIMSPAAFLRQFP